MNNIVNKDCLVGMQELSDNSIDCIVTSPPYNKKGLLGDEEYARQIGRATKD